VINLTLSVEQIDLILSVLAKAPYEVSAEIINEIRNQAIPQLSKEESPSE
jgi:hypothetical protein